MIVQLCSSRMLVVLHLQMHAPSWSSWVRKADETIYRHMFSRLYLCWGGGSYTRANVVDRAHVACLVQLWLRRIRAGANRCPFVLPACLIRRALISVGMIRLHVFHTCFSRIEAKRLLSECRVKVVALGQVHTNSWLPRTEPCTDHCYQWSNCSCCLNQWRLLVDDVWWEV